MTDETEKPQGRGAAWRARRNVEPTLRLKDLSGGALRASMDAADGGAGLSNARLAERLAARGRPEEACNKSFLWFLSSGRRTGATRSLARAIEQELDVPAGALFKDDSPAASGPPAAGPGEGCGP